MIPVDDRPSVFFGFCGVFEIPIKGRLHVRSDIERLDTFLEIRDIAPLTVDRRRSAIQGQGQGQGHRLVLRSGVVAGSEFHGEEDRD